MPSLPFLQYTCYICFLFGDLCVFYYAGVPFVSISVSIDERAGLYHGTQKNSNTLKFVGKEKDILDRQFLVCLKVSIPVIAMLISLFYHEDICLLLCNAVFLFCCPSSLYRDRFLTDQCQINATGKPQSDAWLLWCWKLLWAFKSEFIAREHYLPVVSNGGQSST